MPRWVPHPAKHVSIDMYVCCKHVKGPTENSQNTDLAWADPDPWRLSDPPGREAVQVVLTSGAAAPLRLDQRVESRMKDKRAYKDIADFQFNLEVNNL